MSFLEKNLNALRCKRPEVAEWILSSPELDWVEMIRCHDGTPNLLLTLGNKKDPVYDLDDPFDYPRRVAEEHLIERNGIYLLLGVGLGYTAAELLKRCGLGNAVLVVEPNGHFLRLALTVNDFSEDIAKGKLILTQPERDKIKWTIDSLELAHFGNQPVVILEAYSLFFKDDYDPLLKACYEYLNTRIGVLETLSTRGLMVTTNQITSLPKILLTPGAAEFTDAFKGKPAILVAPGPSLRKNINVLRRAKGKALIIGLAQSLGSLLAHDIVPDVISLVDMQPLFMKHMKGLMAMDHVPLMSACDGYTGIVTGWQGPVIISGVDTMDASRTHYLGRLWDRKGTLKLDSAGGHLAFRFAMLLGADPIIFVGQDLSVDDHGFYFNQYDIPIGQDSQGNTLVEASGPLSGKVEQAVYDPRYDACLFAPGYYGRPVKTTAIMYGQLTYFEQLVAEFDGLTINATEGGVRIEGTEQMKLAEVLDKYCTEPIDADLLKRNQTSDPEAEAVVDTVLKGLKREANLFKMVLESADKALKINLEQQEMFDAEGESVVSNKRFKELLAENEKYTQQARVAAEQVPVLVQAIFGAYRKSISLFTSDDMEERQKIEFGLARNRNMLESAMEAAEQLSEAYQGSIELLERYTAGRDRLAKAPHDPEELIRMAAVYEDMGLFVQAAESIEKAVEAAPNEPKYLAALGELALRREKFDQVSECIDRLAALPGGGELADELRRARRDSLAGLREMAEEEMAKERYALPLLIARRCLEAEPGDEWAKEVLARAEEMRDKAITSVEAEVKEFDAALNGELGRELRYDELLKESRERGKKYDLHGALECLQEAVELIPSRPEAKWGLATTLHHMERYEEALAVYEELTAAFPDNLRFQFEKGLVLLKLERVQEGLETVARLMEVSEDFYGFLPQMAGFYRRLGQHASALAAYDRYLKKFSADYSAWTQRGDCLVEMGDMVRATESYDKALAIKPDFEPALIHKSRTRQWAESAGA